MDQKVQGTYGPVYSVRIVGYDPGGGGFLAMPDTGGPYNVNNVIVHIRIAPQTQIQAILTHIPSGNATNPPPTLYQVSPRVYTLMFPGVNVTPGDEYMLQIYLMDGTGKTVAVTDRIMRF